VSSNRGRLPDRSVTSKPKRLQAALRGWAGRAPEEARICRMEVPLRRRARRMARSYEGPAGRLATAGVPSPECGSIPLTACHP
jgi:hypothetical protein